MVADLPSLYIGADWAVLNINRSANQHQLVRLEVKVCEGEGSRIWILATLDFKWGTPHTNHNPLRHQQAEVSRLLHQTVCCLMHQMHCEGGSVQREQSIAQDSVVITCKFDSFTIFFCWWHITCTVNKIHHTYEYNTRDRLRRHMILVKCACENLSL